MVTSTWMDRQLLESAHDSLKAEIGAEAPIVATAERPPSGSEDELLNGSNEVESGPMPGVYHFVKRPADEMVQLQAM